MVQRSVGTAKYGNMRLSPEGVGESWLCLRRGSHLRLQQKDLAGHFLETGPLGGRSGSTEATQEAVKIHPAGGSGGPGSGAKATQGPGGWYSC